MAKNDNKCPSRLEELFFYLCRPGNARDISVLYISDANIPKRFDQRGKIWGQRKDYSV